MRHLPLRHILHHGLHTENTCNSSTKATTLTSNLLHGHAMSALLLVHEERVDQRHAGRQHGHFETGLVLQPSMPFKARYSHTQVP